MKTVAKRATPVDPFREIVEPATMDRLGDATRRAVVLLSGHTVWHVNSTAEGGGVAEMLHSLLGYYRGFGLDARWVVITATHRLLPSHEAAPQSAARHRCRRRAVGSSGTSSL